MDRSSFLKKRGVSVLAIVPVVLGLVSLAIADSHDQAKNHGGIDQPGATIKGVVKFHGKQAKRKPIRMGADKYCDTFHADGLVRNERYVFGDNNTLQNVFVWISSGLGANEYPAPKSAAVINQQGCVYQPHVLGIVVNQELQIHNSDNTLHNVNCQPGDNASFNEGMPVKGMVISKKFAKPEVAIPIKCDVHPWMTGYLHVVAHPYFAVTGSDGTFEITGLPAGEYEVSVWHEFDKFAPDQSAISVTLTDGQTKEVTVTYSPKGKKK